MSQRTVVLDLAGDHQLARDLVAGGVFVRDDMKVGEWCTVVLRNGDEQLALHAQCVFAKPGSGSGLQLTGCDADMKHRIIALASGMSLETERAHVALDDVADAPTEDTSADTTLDETAPDEPHPDQATTDEQPSEALALDEPEPRPSEPLVTQQLDPLEAATDDVTDEERKIALNVHERLRGLTLVQQVKAAQHGELAERVVLERMYGKNVWEALLRNPRLTGPEVARIARMGQLPRPLMELIVSNGGWLQIPEVRRALLTNSRLGTDQILRVLRLLPKHELRLAAMQTAYPHGVRDAAKRMLKEMAGG